MHGVASFKAYRKELDRSRLGSSGTIVSRQTEQILNDSRRVLQKKF